MRKVGILVVVCLLLATGIMAAMAYTTASVKNDFSVKVVKTQDALLALKASNNHNAAFYSNPDPNRPNTLNLDLSLGRNRKSFGIQRYSEYTWEDLFNVKNNSEHPVKVTVYFASGCTYGPTISAKAEGDWVKLAGATSTTAKEKALTFTLQPGQDQWIDMKTSEVYRKPGGEDKAIYTYDKANFSTRLMVDAEVIIESAD